MGSLQQSDTATPDSLLDEMMRFTRTIINDMARAEVHSSKRGERDIQRIQIYCAANLPDYVRESMNSSQHNHYTFVERSAYSASHPAIVSSFAPAVAKILESNGMTNAKNKRFDTFSGKDFSYGSTTSLLEIDSFAVSTVASADMLLFALKTFNEEQFKTICRQALADRFNEMARFSRDMKEAGIDTSKATSPLEFVEALREAGLKAPAAVEVKPADCRPIEPRKLN